ncbi:MAG: hypothetical protein RR672_07020, partial [Raoultibacter sp.]
AGKAIMEAAKAAGKSLELSGTTLKLKDANGNDLATVEIPSNYTLPTATSAVLGGVKIGQGLSVAADGTISVAISGGMRFMGAKATLAELPTEGNENGDIWLVGTKAPYAEYIWTGSAWEQLGLFDTGFDMSKLLTTDSFMSDEDFLTYVTGV